jgi:hypothetical protein
MPTGATEVAMTKAGSILGIVLAGALSAACQHEETQTAAQTPQQTQAAMTAAGTCPMAQIPGVRATVADTGEGVAITFTAPQSEIDQLRQNVRSMADANDKRGDAFAVCPCGRVYGGTAEAMPSGQGTPSYGPSQSGVTMGQAPAKVAIPPSDSKVDDIPTGAVLTLKAKDSALIPALQASVREDMRALKQGCMNQSSGQAPSDQGNQTPAPPPSR